MKKLVTVRDYPLPMNFKMLDSFLWLASYNLHFVTNFARMAQRLHFLTKKDITGTSLPASFRQAEEATHHSSSPLLSRFVEALCA